MTTMTLDRRDFLRVSAAGTSGLLLGFYLPSSAAEPTNAPFEPNAWLRIAPDGIVTITVAKQEMGQGVLTSLSMIVADELEADWSKVRAVQADAHPNKYGSQGTGGSSSVRTSYEKLRNAGATARGMLIAAAAAAWNAPVADCRAEQGSVINVRNGKKLGYGELASAAASICWWGSTSAIPPISSSRGRPLPGNCCRSHAAGNPESLCFMPTAASSALKLSAAPLAASSVTMAVGLPTCGRFSNMPEPCNPCRLR